ncbi:hypothetical protein ACLOAU_21635 [Niabella sp. CJ426]|uniref:hypothetical protein n=1 Tax=Niabella sp. CJ426 TaxID=3393740 RepID=UPI003D0864F5
MLKKPSKLLAALSLGTAMFLGIRTTSAQCGYFSGYGCPGTNYANYGVGSSGAETLEYDNQVSSFHSSVVRDYTGVFRIWGALSAADGATSLTVPTEINSVNFPGLTGRPLKALVAGGGLPQTIVLTTDGLFVWGQPGTVISTTIKSTSQLERITVNGNATGLPTGVTPTQVKMMFASDLTLAILTCDGHVYVLANYTTNGQPRGDGSAADPNTWAHVQESTAGNPYLTDVVALRGHSVRLMALKRDGTLWTWGQSVYLGGGGTTISQPNRATPMALPPEGSSLIKMIGMTGNTHYVLYENGHLYAMGFNSSRQLGDFTNINKNYWIQPRYTAVAGSEMNDILWISPNEHFSGNQAINVINSAYQVYNWGFNGGLMLGRPTTNINYDPGQPAGISGAEKLLSIESGGHTTMLVKACTENFGYVGHRVNGSMGNGDAATVDVNEPSFTFNTANVQLCGATAVPQILTGGVGTTDALARYCNGTSLVLSALPAGGTWAVTSGAATITGNRLIFNGPGTGTVAISYTTTTADCPTGATATKTFEIADCKMNSVAGTIWNDANGNASQEGSENGISNDLWVNLVAPNGTVVGSAKVADDGTYSIALLVENTVGGDYSVIVTNGERPVGAPLASATAPNGDYGYTGTSVGGVANTGNRTGVIEIGALAGAVTAVDFGISNDPAVLPVKFGFVAAELFNNQLKVKWNTTSELNNSYFEVEASVDGTNFISIGKVNSKANNGISAEALEYEFTKDASAGIVAAGIALLVAGAGLFKARRARYAMMAMALAIVVLAAGCKKSRHDALPEGKVYMRIAQVDKDGTKSYSKVVTVVKR